MTKQEQNDIILSHMDSELRDTPGVAEKVGVAFNKWFQNILASGAPMPAEGPPPPAEEGAPPS